MNRGASSSNRRRSHSTGSRGEAALVRAAAVESLLGRDYPALQIVLVDDRSSDGTGEVIDRVAARDSRISVVHVRELPEGWLGKVHALQRGVERAKGAWLLFTDADVHFAPGTLRRAVACAEERQLDHLAVAAQVILRSFWTGVCHGSAMRGIVALARPWEVMDPRSKKAIGTGAFNLVRRSVFDRTPGFGWLKLEVADDIGLGLMMKRAGARPRQIADMKALCRAGGHNRPTRTFVGSSPSDLKECRQGLASTFTRSVSSDTLETA